jgi:hypothetical protein
MTPEEIEARVVALEIAVQVALGERRVGRFFAQGAIGAARERPRNP